MNNTFLTEKLNNIKAVWNEVKNEKDPKKFFSSLPFGFFSSSAAILLILAALCVFVNGILTLLGFIAVLLEILYLVWYFYNGNKPDVKQLKNNILPFCLVLLLLWSLISAFLSKNIYSSFFGSPYRKEGFFAYLSYAGIFSITAFVKNKKSLRAVLFFHTSAATIVSLLSLFSVFPREKGVFFNANHYGYYLCMMLPLAVGLFISSDKKYRFIYIIEAMLLTTGLIFCHSMGPFLAVVISLLCLTVFVAILHPKKIPELLFDLLLCAAAGTVCAVYSWDLIADLKTLFADAGTAAAKFSGDTSQETEEAFNKIGSSRGVLWKYAWQFACERPVFGYGPDCFFDLYYLKTGVLNQRPHNEFLQIAASLGFPALAFYLSGLGSLFVRFIQIFKKLSLLQLTLFVCVLSYLISSFFGNTMYYTSPYFFMLLGFCFNLSKNENDKIMKNE